MTNEQITYVRESFAVIQESSMAVGLLFYGRLFELDPSLRLLFQNDLRAQTRKLMGTLGTIVESLDDLNKMRSYLRHLGDRHHKEFRVRPEHYETLRKALLWAFAHALEVQFSPDVRESWSQAIEEINRIMQSGAINNTAM